MIGNNLTFFLFFFFFFFVPFCRPVKCRRLHLIYLCEYEIIAFCFLGLPLKPAFRKFKQKCPPGQGMPFKSHHFDGGIIIQVLIS